MRFFTVFLLTAAVLFSQNQSHEFIVIPSGANVGTMKFSELTINGMEGITIKAPDALDADSIWTLPAQTGTAGYWYDPGTGVLELAGGGGVGLPVTATIIGQDQGANKIWSFDNYSSHNPWDKPIISLRRARGTIAVPEDVVSNDDTGGIISQRFTGGWFNNTQLVMNYNSAIGGVYRFYVYDALDTTQLVSEMDSTGLNVNIGNFYVGGTTVVDSTQNITSKNVMPQSRDTHSIGSASNPFFNVTANRLEFAPAVSTGLWKFRANSVNDMIFEAPDNSPVWTYYLPTKSMYINGGLYPNGSTGFKLGSSSLRWDGTFNDVTILGTCTGCDVLPHSSGSIIAKGNPGAADLLLQSWANNSAASSNFRFYKARGTEANPLPIVSGDMIARPAVGYGRDSTGDDQIAAQIQFRARNVGSNFVDGAIHIIPYLNGAETSALVAHPDGSVSVNSSTDPAETLWVNGSAQIVGTINSTGAATFQNNITLGGNFILTGGSAFVDGDLDPLGTEDLGSTSARWANLVVGSIDANFIDVNNDVDITGSVAAGEWDGNLLPGTDGIGTLGNAGQLWQSVHTPNIESNSNINLVVGTAGSNLVSTDGWFIPQQAGLQIGATTARWGKSYFDSVDVEEFGTCTSGMYALISIGANNATFCYNGTVKNVTYD